MIVNNAGFILNLITLGIGIFTLLISLLICIGLIHYISYNRMKPGDKVTIIHCIHIYLMLFVLAVIVVSFNIQTLLGDLYDQNFDTSWCKFMGYLGIICVCALYWSFVNQAFFRLCRIVYSKYRWLQHVRFYIVGFPIELLLICGLFCPLLFWHDIVYLPDEYYCFIYFPNTRSAVWLLANMYGLALSLLSLIYVHIIVYLRQHSNNQTMIVKLHQQRDLKVIQRILIILSLLMTLGVPGTVMLFMYYFTGIIHPLFYRIEWLAISTSLMAITFVSVIFTPQLKNIVKKKFQNNQVIPLRVIAR